MTVRKKAEGTDVFEDIIKQEDKIVQFTIEQLDHQIASWRRRKNDAQAEIDKVEARKAAAEAL